MERKRRPEVHTLAELCHDLFRIKEELCQISGYLLTQEVLNEMPPVIRLANREAILEIGLDPNLDPVYEKQAIDQKLLETRVPEGQYYLLLDRATPKWTF